MLDLARSSSFFRRVKSEWSIRTALKHNAVRKPKTEEDYKRAFATLRCLFEEGIGKNSTLFHLSRLLRKDVRWIMALNGGGSMRSLLTDIFAIADNCSAEQITETFPIALIDEWARRQLPGNEVKRELILWAANRAATMGGEDAFLLAANFSQDDLQRLQRINEAFSASGTDARLSVCHAPVPFEFGAHSATENGPLVSVLMSAYNSASTIRRAASSILTQTWRNIELIITDDVSTDDTASVVAELMQQDSRVKFRQNGKNVGPYVSRNMALAVAKGKFITCHDADDIAHPQRIAVQMNALAAAPACAANISNWIRVDQNGRVVPTSFKNFVQANYSALLIRSEVFEAIGYWDSVRTTADSEYRERIKRRFGNPAEQHVRQMLALGQSCLTTLTGAPATESSWLNYSQTRMKYRQNYKAWHDSVAPPSLYMPFPLQLRPFEVPSEMSRNTTGA